MPDIILSKVNSIPDTGLKRQMSHRIRKPTKYKGENKGADQLLGPPRGFREKGYLFSGIWGESITFWGFREQRAEEKHFRSWGERSFFFQGAGSKDPLWRGLSFAVIAKLTSAFVFTTRIVPFLFSLNPNFKLLAIFYTCRDWFVSDVDGTPNCWFAHAKGQMKSNVKSAFESI